MKLLTSLLVLVSLTCFAQKPLPVVATTTVPTLEQGRRLILEREHDVIDLFALSDGSATAGTVGQIITGSNQTVPYGLQAIIHSITITADGPCTITGYIRKGIYAYTNPKAVLTISAAFGVNGGSATFDFGAEGFTMLGGGGVGLIKVLTTTTNPTVKCFVANKAISDDGHPEAKKAYVSMGNSMSWGTLGATATNYPNMGETHFAARINSALRTAGVDSRKVLRGFGGSVALHWVQAIDAGMLKTQQMDLVSILLGTNEAANADVSAVDATTGMTFPQMIQYIVDYVFAQNPAASVILIGPPNSSSSPRNTNMAGYRTALAAIPGLAKYTGKDLLYYDASGNISAPTTTDVNYVEVGTGQQIHLRGDTGHLKLYQGLWPIVQQTKFYTNSVNLAKPLIP